MAKKLTKAQTGKNVKGNPVIDPALRERLIRQQKNKPVSGVMNYKTSENWADNYSLDTTGLAKGANTLYPYRRSNGTKGAVTKPEAKKIVENVKSGKVKSSNWSFEKKGGTIKKKK